MSVFFPFEISFYHMLGLATVVSYKSALGRLLHAFGIDVNIFYDFNKAVFLIISNKFV